MAGGGVNLIEMLVPQYQTPHPTRAERAEGAENQQPQGLPSPPLGAGKGGKVAYADEIRPNPPPGAESEALIITSFPPNPPNPPHATLTVESPLPVTLEYFANKGVHLLPEDLAFLRWHLPRATQSRNAAVAQYLKAWRLAAEAEPVPHRKENAGRFAANCWLRGVSL